MSSDKTTPTLDKLVFSVIPNLNLAQTLVTDTLESLIERASDPLEVLKRRDQKERFNLEIHRLRFTLEALLERYRADVNALLSGENHPPSELVLGDEDVVAINEAIAIYHHVRAFQRGERVNPVPGPAVR
ncbi:hypothetical protein [Vreelandella sp. EE22]